uniref:MRN complex-interacting protein N-terminal domain-containing protein n=1 Tax=Electrophorus electricus TaxID=8005 RepID=A0AAY5ER06_ELEEL
TPLCNFILLKVKKSKKWSCKMCGEKQSLIKEYGRGTGADCRRHVQKLNLLHQMDSRPRDDEDNEEDENVCTGRERFRSRHNIRSDQWLYILPVHNKYKYF